MSLVGCRARFAIPPSQPTHPPTFCPLPLATRRLQEAAKQAEEEGERLLGQLSGGQLALEPFVEQYTRVQASFHQRDLKLQAAQQTLPGAGPR